MSQAAADVARALALLKGLTFVMGRRDKAFDVAVKEAVEYLEKARGALGTAPAPSASAGLEPSIVEWIYGAADNALKAAEFMPAEAVQPTKVEVLSGALLSIREWALRQLPPEKQPQPPAGALEPLQLR